MARTRISLAALAARIGAAHTGSALRWRTSLRSVLAVMAACGLTFATLVASPAGAVASTHQYVIDELAKPEYAGRQAGTAGYAKAVTYMEQQMREVGILPVISETDYQIPYTATTAVLKSESVSINGVKLALGVDYLTFARDPSTSRSWNGAYYAGDGAASDYSTEPVSGLVVFHWNRADRTFGGGIADRVQLAISHGATGVIVILDGELLASNFEHPLGATVLETPVMYVSTAAALRAGIPNTHKPAAVRALQVDYSMQIDRGSGAAADLLGVIPGRQEDHAVLWLTNIDSFGTLPDGRYFQGAVAGSAAAAMMLDIAAEYLAQTPEFTQLFAFVGSKWTDKAGTDALAARLNWSHIDATIDIYAMGATGTSQKLNVGYTDKTFASTVTSVWPRAFFNSDIGNGLSSRLLDSTSKSVMLRDVDTWIDDSLTDTPERVSASAYRTGLETLRGFGARLEAALQPSTVGPALAADFVSTSIGTEHYSVQQTNSQRFDVYVDQVDAPKLTLDMLKAFDRIYDSIRFYNYDVTIASRPTALFIQDGKVAADVCRRTDLLQNPEAAGGGFASLTSDFLCIYQKRSGTSSEPIYLGNVAHEFNHAAANALTYFKRQPGLQEWQGQSHIVRVSSVTGIGYSRASDIVRGLVDGDVPRLLTLIQNYSTDIDWRWFTDAANNALGWQYTYHVAGSQYAFIADQYGVWVSRRAMYRNYQDVSKYKVNLIADTGLTWDEFCVRWSYWMLHSGQAKDVVPAELKARVDRNTSFDYMLLYTRPANASSSNSQGSASGGNNLVASIASDGSLTLSFAGTAAADITSAKISVTQDSTDYIVSFSLTSGVDRHLSVFIAPDKVIGVQAVRKGANTLTQRIPKAVAASGQLMFMFFVDDSNRALFQINAASLKNAPLVGAPVVTPTASPSPTPSPTNAPSPSPSPTTTPQPSPIASSSPSATPLPTVTVTVTATPLPAPTVTVTASARPAPTVTITAEPAPTVTVTAMPTAEIAALTAQVVQLQSEAAAAAAQAKADLEQITALLAENAKLKSAQAASPVTTITCANTKTKATKKVTAVNPKCPTGFKKL